MIQLKLQKATPFSKLSTAEKAYSSQKLDDIGENSQEEGNTMKSGSKSVKFQQKPKSPRLSSKFSPNQLQTKLIPNLVGGAKAKQQQSGGDQED
jgi:hypothetical protein